MDSGLTNTSDTYHPDDVWSAIESDAMTPPSDMWETWAGGDVTADSSDNWNSEQLNFETLEFTYLTIEESAFSFRAIPTITLTGINGIGPSAFQYIFDSTTPTAPASGIQSTLTIDFNNSEDGVIGTSAFQSTYFDTVTIKNSGDGAYTFDGQVCSGAIIGDLTLGNGLTSISNLAFKDAQIPKITINSDPQTPYTIGESAFHGNEALTTLDFGSNLQSIGKGAFQIGENAVNKLDAVTIDTDYPALIGEAAFSFRAIPTITLTGINGIGPSAFQYIFDSTTPTAPASGIQSTLTIDFNNSEDGVIGTSAFQSTYFDTVTIKNSGDGAYTFDGQVCWGAIIGDLTLGNGLTSISNLAFKDAQIPKITINTETPYTIGEAAFHGNEALTTLDFGLNLQSIGKGAFQIGENAVNKLDAVTIDTDYPALIGEAAFSFRAIPTITLTGINGIGPSAFQYIFDSTTPTAPASGIQSTLTIDFNNSEDGVIGTSAFQSTYFDTVTIKNSGDGAYTFDGQVCSGAIIGDLTLGNGLTSISNLAFKDAQIPKITINTETPYTIGEAAFHGNEALTTLDFGLNLQSIGKGAFQIGENAVNKLDALTIDTDYPALIGEAAFSFRAIPTITLTGINGIGPSAFQYIFDSTTPTAPASGIQSTLTIDFNNSEDGVIGTSAFQSTYFDTVTIKKLGRRCIYF